MSPMADEEKREERPRRKSMEKMSYAEKGRFFRVRNVLNIVFILLTIVGMAVFFYSSRYTGGVILIVCVGVKLVECVLRIIR